MRASALALALLTVGTLWAPVSGGVGGWEWGGELHAAVQDTSRRPRPPRDTAAARRDSVRRDTSAAARDTSARVDSLPPTQPSDSALSLNLRGRLEAKTERTKNERCSSSQLFNTAFSCAGRFTPAFDFQFNLLTSGTVADRLHVNVDYDTQREFDASNNISIFYQGRDREVFQRVEVGNVSFATPASRFITAGIPSGNYGLQAIGHLGPMRFRTIAAQQKGNIVREELFVIGDRAVQTLDREIEDYQVEPRRFFFTVDPTLFGSRYPNMDLLDGAQMQSLAASLPDSVRPSRVFLYRLLIGGQPPNPNGPRFRLLGVPDSRRGQVYELLRENIDYYLDPSLLWFALVRPLGITNERLVVAYTVRIGGRDTTIATTGGTPDLEFVPGRDQLANLVWDPQVTPNDDAFRREIRAFYRIGGEDVRRQTVSVRLVTGASADQEKPPAGNADTYLQHFGLAQRTNSSTFDVENRLWPRPSDPNMQGSAGSGDLGRKVIPDYFLVFPSVQPFARAGLAQPAGIPANDTIYRTSSEYLYSVQHPQSAYRIRVRYESEGGGGAGFITLNSVQIRQGSERIVIDGRPLVRDLDYTIDYDLGRVTFTRPDTLSGIRRRVTVRFEENPLFASVPTTIYGLTTEFPLDNGSLSFTAISQTQRTSFTRPPIGFEPASSLVAGVNGAFAWNATALTRALTRLPFVDSAGPSRIELEGEFAVSRPQTNARGQAYVESFEGEGGLSVNLAEQFWYYSSQPALGGRLPARVGAGVLDVSRAATMAWQNNGTDRNDQPVRFTIEQIDSLVTLQGAGFSAPETLLWLTLYPLRAGGLFDPASRTYRWTVPNTPTGRRWRSIRTSLGPTGADLTRVEDIEFWALVDTSATRLKTNPVVVLDFGEVSENSVAFAPETLTVRGGGGGSADSMYSGKRLQGFDVLDSERDPFSRAFNVNVNDRGLPGDLLDRLTVVTGGAAVQDDSVAVCSRGDVTLRPIGDSRNNCTVRNNRLDEEDIDQDNVLNLTSAQREQERLRRYIVDMSDTTTFTRIGVCGRQLLDINDSRPQGSTLCWVNFRVPFAAPDDSTNDGPLLRRVRALRITMISGEGIRDEAFTTVPLARLRLLGAPWLKRADRPLRGIAGETEAPGTGYVLTSLIGSQDLDPRSGVFYQNPPGVGDVPDDLTTPFDPARVQTNNRSLRLLAGGLAKYDRAEAFFRFPEGQRSFMSYKELRVWARGRGRGWERSIPGGAAPGSELQFYLKIGRDADNFYLYRTSANSGNTQSAWNPEIRIRFDKFYALRARLENAFLRGGADSIACTGVDSALIARSGLPSGTALTRRAACSDGYIVYTTDPTVSPPNLAAVQELAVGIVRVDSATGPDPIIPGDTLELWVDEVRLADVVNETGFAGRIAAAVTAGDIGSLRLDLTRRDPNFRQLAEQPTFLTDNDLQISSTWRLDRFLPRTFGLSLPLTIVHSSRTVEPRFVSRSDIRGEGVEGLRTPRDAVTTYALTIQRSTPLTGSPLAPLLNHLSATATYRSADARTEFQRGAARNFSVGVDYLIAGAGDSPETAPGWLDQLLAALPDWGPLGALQGGRVRLTPTRFRLTSGVVRNTDRRASFLKPAASPDDSARVVTGLDHVWRNGSVLELRPTNAFSARWNVISLRDLRDYGNSTTIGMVASAERSRLAGLDVGLERERVLESAFSLTPNVASWIRPRLDFGTTYSMLRDPNARTLLFTGDTAGSPRLPRRLASTQSLTAAATVDVVKAMARTAGDSSRRGRIARIFQPIDVSFGRNVLSAFDGTPFTPGLGYQLGWGGVNDFRRVRGRLSSSAGLTTQLSVTNGLALPFNVTVAHRYQHIDTKQWARRLRDTQSEISGEQVVYPDLSLRWSATPKLFGGLIESVGANARMLHSKQSTLVPVEGTLLRPELRSTRVRSYPLGASLVWGPGNVSMAAGYSTSTRLDSLPGSVGRGSSRELNAEVGRPFRLPPRFNLKNDVRTRLSFQRTYTKSDVENAAAVGLRSRLTDNGRQAVDLSADTELSETLGFSLQGSRIITFDRNFNRRFSQTVFTAVLQMQFFGGELR